MHTRRTPVRLLLPAVLLTAAAALAGCGSSDSSGSSGGDTLGVEAVHVSGDVGDSATVSFDGKVSDTTPQTKTLTTGTGPELQTGDTFAAQIVVADGFTQKTAQSSYDQHAPQVVTLSSTLPSWLLDALKGQTIGSRILVYTAADKIYGSTGNAQLGISNKDMLAVVLDLVGKALPGPTGASHAEPSWAPKIEKTKGVVSGLNFAGTPKPNGKLRVGVLRSGTGATVAKGQTIAVNYLGSVYKAKAPFDESFSKQPVGFVIGENQVIPGWDKALVGQKVGSEVILQIPPADGYADQPPQGSGIPKNATLYFVVDILGAF